MPCSLVTNSTITVHVNSIRYCFIIVGVTIYMYSRKIKTIYLHFQAFPYHTDMEVNPLESASCTVLQISVWRLAAWTTFNWEVWLAIYFIEIWSSLNEMDPFWVQSPLIQNDLQCHVFSQNTIIASGWKERKQWRKPVLQAWMRWPCQNKLQLEH